MGKVIEPGRLTHGDRARIELCGPHSRMVAEAMDALEWEGILRILYGGALPPPPDQKPSSPRSSTSSPSLSARRRP